MKNDNVKKLEKELRFLVESERKEEIAQYQNQLDENADIKNIAKEIYLRRGIDYKTLKSNSLEEVTNTINNFSKSFQNKDKETKKKMTMDIIYMIVLIILLKIPFDLVRDIGADYITIIATNNLYYKIWRIVFLLIYTVIAICTAVVLIRNFNKKYQN